LKKNRRRESEQVGSFFLSLTNNQYLVSNHLLLCILLLQDLHDDRHSQIQAKVVVSLMSKQSTANGITVSLCLLLLQSLPLTIILHFSIINPLHSTVVNSGTWNLVGKWICRNMKANCSILSVYKNKCHKMSVNMFFSLFFTKKKKKKKYLTFFLDFRILYFVCHFRNLIIDSTLSAKFSSINRATTS
jgi:hypothetical protein